MWQIRKSTIRRIASIVVILLAIGAWISSVRKEHQGEQASVTAQNTTIASTGQESGFSSRPSLRPRYGAFTFASDELCAAEGAEEHEIKREIKREPLPYKDLAGIAYRRADLYHPDSEVAAALHDDSFYTAESLQCDRAIWRMAEKETATKSGNSEATTSRLYEPFNAIFLEEPEAGNFVATQLIRFETYSVSYHTEWRQAQWVAYRLDRERLERNVPRAPNISLDKRIPEKTADWFDYKTPGIDRGHLLPAADARWNALAQEQASCYINMAPQTSAFNQGIWNTLEQRVRGWARRCDVLYIATGPCFLGEPIGHLGRRKIPIATHFYKALLAYKNGEWYAAAFLIPHDAPVDAEYNRYRITVDELEEKVGIDFFPLLPQTLQDSVEAVVNMKFWR